MAGSHGTMTQPPEGSPLDLAQQALTGRAENYGHPADNFEHIASLWRALFGWDVRAEDIPLAMILLKVSRLQRTPGHEDSAVDVAGYAQAYWMACERSGCRPRESNPHPVGPGLKPGVSTSSTRAA